MYRIVVLLLLFILSAPVFATRTVVTQSPDPYYGAYYGGDYVPRYHKRHSSGFYDINDLEKYAMNKNFTRDSDRIRLERLETLAFGAVQEGDIYTRYDNVRNAILSRPKQNYKTSLLKNISDYFGGQMTGFTPPMSQASYFNNPNAFGKSYSTGYSNPWGHKCNTSNYGSGSGTSIHLLD